MTKQMTPNEIKKLFEKVAVRENGRVDGVVWSVNSKGKRAVDLCCKYGESMHYLYFHEPYKVSDFEFCIDDNSTTIYNDEELRLFNNAVNILTTLYNQIAGNDQITPEGLEGLGFESTNPSNDHFVLEGSFSPPVFVSKDFQSDLFRVVVCGYYADRIKTLTQLKHLIQLLGVEDE